MSPRTARLPMNRPDAMLDPLRDDPRIEVDPTGLGDAETGVRAAARQLARIARAALTTRRHAPPAVSSRRGDAARAARVERFAVDALRLEGPDPMSGQRLVLLYIGNGTDLEYVRELAFSPAAANPLTLALSPDDMGEGSRGAATTTVLARGRSPLAIRALLRAHRGGTDVIVIDTHLAAERLLVPRRFHHVPRWVKQTLATGGPARTVNERVGTRTLSWARRVLRRHDYRVDLAVTDPARRQFFHELYGPFIRQRFGADAIVVDEDRFRHETRGAGVLRLWAGNEIVAGAIVRAAAAELQIVWFGAKTDAAARGLKGLSDALDYAALCLARRGGFERLHFGSSRPSLADGVLRYKQKWGATIERGRLPRADLRVAVDAASAASRGFLARARLIVRNRSALCELLPSGAARSLPAHRGRGRPHPRSEAGPCPS